CGTAKTALGVCREVLLKARDSTTIFQAPQFSNTIFRSLGSRIGWGAKKELATAAPFKILGIDHVVLRAADPAALERFYLDVLGLTFELRQGKLAQLRAGRARIDIVPATRFASQAGYP